MRYLIYTAAVLVGVALWFNTSHQGNRIKRQMSEHPADPSQLWAN